MTGRAALIALWLALWAIAPAGAQVVTVAAGEHAGFTRLVLQSPGRFPWRAQIDTQGATLRLPPQALLQGLDGVFSRIPRARLADLRAEGGELRLDLGCDCTLSIWEEREGLVIIDITEGAPPPPREPSLAEIAGTALARDRRQGAAQTPDPAPSLAPMVLDALAREVALAQSRGLLQPASPVSIEPQALVPVEPAFTEPIAQAHLRITSALERPSIEALTLEQSPAPDACNGISVLDFLADEPPSPFVDAHAALMAQAYGEFDLPNAPALSELIALYLQNAMGAEARALIDLAPPAEPGATFLRAVADLLENRPSNALPHLGRAAECGDIPLALAFAARMPGLAPDPQSGARAALGFALLSAPMRLALGPDLAESLLSAGLGDAGESVIAAIRHEPDLAPATLARLEALASALQGRDGPAIDRLQSAQGMDAMSLRLQLDLMRARGEVPMPALLDTAEALAATLRQEPPGMDLLFLAAELRAMGGELDAALDAIERAKLWARERPALWPQISVAEAAVWQVIADTPSDADFLETALSHDGWRRPEMAVTVTAAVANRLSQFGLAPLQGAAPGAGSGSALTDDMVEGERAVATDETDIRAAMIDEALGGVQSDVGVPSPPAAASTQAAPPLQDLAAQGEPAARQDAPPPQDAATDRPVPPAETMESPNQSAAEEGVIPFGAEGDRARNEVPPPTSVNPMEQAASLLANGEALRAAAAALAREP